MNRLPPFLNHPLFRLKNMRTIRDVLQGLQIREYSLPEGEYLIRKREVLNSLTLLISGEMLKDESFPVSTGTIIEPAASVISSRVYSSYRCTSTCSFAEIPVAPLLCHPDIRENLLNLVAEEAVAKEKQLSLLRLKSVKQKVATFFLYESENRNSFTLALNKKQIARYLNISEVSLSQTLLNLKEDRSVISQGRRYSVDRHKLTEKIR